MAANKPTSTAEMLLQLLEITSLGAVSTEQIVKQLRRGHPFSRLDRRVSGGLAMLAVEGLIESFADPDAGQMLHRTTPSGLATLEQKGRFSGAAAVLFTDIVGSTELIDALGEDEAHASRQRHFAQLREAVNKFGGREVKSLGDGLMVVFAATRAAFACAAEMQRRVASDSDQLGLRVGVHTGELLREGNDYFGSTVIIARRLCDSAQAGQIVVSEAAVEDVAARTDEALELEPLGLVELKGLSEPLAACTLVTVG
jgi:class 3 adenylate cyclase